ncbi:hypothetical protein CFC21_062958 [Triticum aestivum]|uniref:Uncharacterized protein n=2 Tax=Triticum aestivum TaxID=4565 RepID=A0A9R1KIN7_WHEAT|nr:hypothetical protein CFC21_062958 [Triticum aestivum]
MYKEYRRQGDVQRWLPVTARSPCTQIIKTATVHFSICKRDSTKQFHKSDTRFPLVYQKAGQPTRKLKTTFKASRPNLFILSKSYVHNLFLQGPSTGEQAPSTPSPGAGNVNIRAG